MNSTRRAWAPWKLCGLALALICWYFPNARGVAGLVVPLGVLVLLAGLDAAHREGVKLGLGGEGRAAEVNPFQVIRGMGSISVGCFYVLLAGLMMVGQMVAGPEFGTTGTQVAQAVTDGGCGSGGGCGVSGGCGSGGCGASTGGGCGCGKKGGATAKAALLNVAPARRAPENAAAQLEARVAAMKKRTMNTAAPVAVPEMGPEAKPLPQGLMPSKPDTAVAPVPSVSTPAPVVVAPGVPAPSAVPPAAEPQGQ